MNVRIHLTFLNMCFVTYTSKVSKISCFSFSFQKDCCKYLKKYQFRLEKHDPRADPNVVTLLKTTLFFGGVTLHLKIHKYM